MDGLGPTIYFDTRAGRRTCTVRPRAVGVTRVTYGALDRRIESRGQPGVNRRGSHRGSLPGQGCRHVNRRGFRCCGVGGTSSLVPVPVGFTRDTDGVLDRRSEPLRAAGPVLPCRGPPGGSVRRLGTGTGGPDSPGAGLMGPVWDTFCVLDRRSDLPRTARCQTSRTVLRTAGPVLPYRGSPWSPSPGAVGPVPHGPVALEPPGTFEPSAGSGHEPSAGLRSPLRAGSPEHTPVSPGASRRGARCGASCRGQ
jgi:hypothetical protein